MAGGTGTPSAVHLVSSRFVHSVRVYTTLLILSKYNWHTLTHLTKYMHAMQLCQERERESWNGETDRICMILSSHINDMHFISSIYFEWLIYFKANVYFWNFLYIWNHVDKTSRIRSMLDIFELILIYIFQFSLASLS